MLTGGSAESPKAVISQICRLVVRSMVLLIASCSERSFRKLCRKYVPKVIHQCSVREFIEKDAYIGGTVRFKGSVWDKRNNPINQECQMDDGD